MGTFWGRRITPELIDQITSAVKSHHSLISLMVLLPTFSYINATTVHYLSTRGYSQNTKSRSSSTGHSGWNREIPVPALPHMFSCSLEESWNCINSLSKLKIKETVAGCVACPPTGYCYQGTVLEGQGKEQEDRENWVRYGAGNAEE